MKYFRLTILGIGLLILCVVFPFLFIFRPFNHRNTSLYLKTVKKLFVPFLGIEYEIINKENMINNLPAILVGNHQSNWDFLMATIVFNEKIVYLAKSQIAFIPFFGQLYSLGGNILVNRSNPKKARESMGKVEKILRKNKIGVVIFPEGHRNPNTKLLPFKHGAFRSAIAAQVPIIPFSVNFYLKDLNLSKLKSGKIIVKFHDPIPTKGLAYQSITPLSDKCNEIIQQGMDELNKNNQY